VVSPFVDAYAGGVTPSPCTICNRTVKLAELEGIADRLGAVGIATGHYARVLVDSRGHLRIARGVDSEKDQSYFLYATPASLITRLVFPLGNSRKPEVRNEALSANLPGANKGESQELCFVGDDYVRFVEERTSTRRKGRILNVLGQEVATHDGVHRFTIGQRKGLGIALGERAFVTDIEADTGDIYLGPAEALLRSEAVASDLVLGEGIALPLQTTASVRYRHAPVAVRVHANHHDEEASRALSSTTIKLAFEVPVRALTPGQIAVLYEGDCVLGGARIDQVARNADVARQPAEEAAGEHSRQDLRARQA
jgi:tRNA-uridine 2-sulfurtransferase